MRIPRSDRRQAIDDTLASAARRFDPTSAAFYRAFYDGIGEIGGIEIVERVPFSDPRSDETDHCAEYVWRRIHATLSQDERAHLPTQPTLRQALAHLGYVTHGSPQERSVVGYREGEEGEIRHWGIYEDGSVTSKLRQGHVYRHDVSMVANALGEEAIFFSRQ